MEEKSLRERLKGSGLEILYEDNRYLVSRDVRSEDSYHLLVNNAYAFLDRGILRDLAGRDTQGLRSGLRNVGEMVLDEMEREDIPLEELSLTLSRVMVKKRNYMLSI